MKKSSVRSLTKTLALISLLAPATGYSLGIGGIKLHSALNQNLNAEIPLVVSAGEKASDIKVNLASPDKFDQAGVPWAAFLSQIKFTTVTRANGSMVIKLSSNETVKEPFLNFLLEVSWPKGSLYREFTVLVDPPESYEPSTLAVPTGSSNYQTQQKVLAPRQITQAWQEKIGGTSEYGPTTRNDTLWKIAERVGKREAVSVEQAMIAVYKENPHAFYQDNMNALLAGKMLKIPDRTDVLKFSRTQATAELNLQTKAWKSRLSQSVPIEATKAKSASDNQLTLVAPAEDGVAEKVEAAPENGQITPAKQTTTAELQAADEKAFKSPVDGALQDRVAELEKQLATIQQIIVKKDQQLAALQEQLQIKPVKAVPGAAETALSQQKPAAPVKAEPEAGAFSDAYYLWVSGIGIGVLSLLGWAWWRKHQVNNEEAAIPTSFVTFKDAPSLSLVKDSTVYDAEAAEKRILFGEANCADFDAFDKDQGDIDPISEADVYLAYGRYKQAEDLMRDTLKEHPERDECKLKLLEIYYSKKDKQAFESYIGELAEKGQKNKMEFWAKVKEMAREICPESLLFSSGAVGVSAEKTAFFEKRLINTTQSDVVQADMTVNAIKEADFDPTAFSEFVNDEAVKEEPELAGGLLDFDSAFNDDVVDDDWKNNESIDFDLDELTDNTELDKAHHNVLKKSQEIAGKDEFESLDLNFNVKSDEESEIDEIEFSAVNEFGEDHQHIDLSSGKGAGLSNDPLEADFEFDFDMLVDQQHSRLNDMDELETKLDLAMAYIDMNDSDAAKDIAREVLEKGSPEQQVTAQTLLDRLI
jgi:pilus assembly protein FimV